MTFPYVLRRLILVVPTVLFISALTFFASELAPSDPIQILAGEHATPDQIARLRHEYGLDRPLLVRFGDFIWGAFQLDFGRSYFDTRSVREIILANFVPTAVLAVLAMVIATLVGMTLGILAAVYSGCWPDRVAVILSVSGLGVPNFVLAPILVLLFAVRLQILPVTGWPSYGSEPWRFLILPVAVLSLRPMASVMRLTRTSMTEALAQDYIRTARSKGVSRTGVILRHALRNALTPILLGVGSSFGYLLTGSFIVETAFAIPGLGYRAIEAILQRDYPVIQATTVLFATAFILVNLIVDLLQLRIDPRIRLEKAVA